jgi:O-succinylbenzoate synthase
VKIEGIEATVAALRLRVPVHSSGLTHSDNTTLFVRVVTDGPSGWGECAARAGARSPDPTVEAVEPAVVDRVVGRLFDACDRGDLPPAASVVEACIGGGSTAEQSVAAALEMAVLDAELLSTTRSLASFLGVVRREVETGALVGIPDARDLGALVDSVAEAIDGGARRIRLKIEPGWDHRPLGAVRERFTDAVLQADANGSFGPDSAPGLRGLDAYGLRCLEQPFPPEDLDAHRALADTMSTPIALDESLWSPARVREAVELGACRVACLKPGRLGGVLAALAAAEACAEAGVECFVGGFFESGLGRSVNAALAGRAEFGLPGDLGDPDRYLDANPFSYLEQRPGVVRLSDAPGLGARLREEVLAAHRVHTRWLPYGS